MFNKVQKAPFDLYQNGEMRDLFWSVGSKFKTAQEKIFILVHDGQNCFEDIYASYQKSWRIPEVLAKLDVRNYLIAGIASLNGVARIREYSPVANRLGLETEPGFETLLNFPLGGQNYLQTLINNLIPYLEKTFDFKFSEVKSIMIGSSMGGVITTYAAKSYPTLFHSYLAFSNAFYANDPEIYSFIEKDAKIGRYYHDMGGQELSGSVASERHYVEAYNRMNAYLQRVDANFYSVFESQAVHDEKAWHKRLYGALLWALAW